MGLKVMGQFYGIKNDIFALSKHFFSQGGGSGGPPKKFKFFSGVHIFGGPQAPQKVKKSEKKIFGSFYYIKRNTFFCLCNFF